MNEGTIKSERNLNISFLGMLSFVLGIVSLALALPSLMVATFIGFFAILTGVIGAVRDTKNQAKTLFPISGLLFGIIPVTGFLVIIF